MRTQPCDVTLLQSDLAALHDALQADDTQLAEQIMHSHDRHLRQYIAERGAHVDIDSLRELLALQHSLSREMLSRRDRAAAHLRQHRQSRQAVSAYQHAQEM